MSEPLLLEVRDLHVRFRGGKGAVARAVDGVDLDVRAGRGAGARRRVGLRQDDARAHDPRARAAGRRARCGSAAQPLDYDARVADGATGASVQMVFQDPTGALNPRQTIYEAVAEGLRIQRVARRRGGARRRRARRGRGCGPPERFFPLYPYEVSGGQRQRVVIAGAMVLEPRLIVADEPVSSLDASVRGEILQLMLGLVQETGVTILVVTHDLGLAWNIADRDRRHVPRPDRRAGNDRGAARRPAPPVHAGAALGRPEVERMEQQILAGRGARSDADPAGLPLPPALPARRVGRGGAARDRRALPRRGSRARTPVRGAAAGSVHVAACHAVG